MTETNESPPPRLRELFEEQIVSDLMKEFDYDNLLEVPKIRKVVLNMGLGEATENPKILDDAVEELAAISGQKPVIRRAKKSIANFKVRAGMPIGAAVTLRKDRMYEFFDRLVNIALPRIRDFKGVSAKSFDGRGNYSLGITEQTIFPEIPYDQVEAVRGLGVTIVTSAETDEEARALLEKLGMPFRN